MTVERQFVNYRIEDRIAVVTLNRPPVNALSPQLEDEIEGTFEELAARGEAGAVIVTGGGSKAFIAGADIKLFPQKTPQSALEMSTATQRLLSKIESFDRVVIAAVNGLALGGGSEVALACDIRVADGAAIFGFPEVSLGLMPGAGGTQRLTRLVGFGKAMELILTGDPIDAEEAKRIGLVEKVAPRGEAVAEARKLATRILSRGPIAVASAKKAIMEGLDMTFADGLKREAELFAALFKTHDAKEGVGAFLEKRKPNFTGT
jgi:enoyl-CoA hydratase